MLIGIRWLNFKGIAKYTDIFDSSILSSRDLDTTMTHQVLKPNGRHSTFAICRARKNGLDITLDYEDLNP